MLKQQPARDAPRLGIVTRREPDQARDLLRLPEIMLGGIADRCALERHDALIALAACRLVEGDRQESLAEQGEEGRIRSETKTSKLQSLMRISYSVICM